MTKGILLAILSLFSQNLICQLTRNASWVLGNSRSGNLLEFKDTLTLTLIDPGIYMAGSNSSISDLGGKLLFYTNSCWVANSEFEIMKGGDTINPNYFKYGACKNYDGNPSPGCVITEYPGKKDLYYIFNIDVDIPYFGIDSFIGIAPQRVLYHVIDMSKDSGRGEVILKNQIALYDTLGRASLVACRHSNQKDFWLIVPKSHSNCYFVFLVDEQGVQIPTLQCLGEKWTDLDTQGQSVFSPDGKLYARMNRWNGLNIYDFDNNTGLLSNPRPRIHFKQDSFILTGLAFSPNSRYLYASPVFKVLQYDMQALNIEASQSIIAQYDGFKNPYATIFYISALAPDGKIYISSTSSTYNLHVINKPDCPGKASEIVQHGIELPGLNFSSIPTQPHYDYLPTTYTCDSTLNNLMEDLRSKRLFDVNSSIVVDRLKITYHGTQFNEKRILRLNHLSGANFVFSLFSQTFNEIDLSSIPSGIYILNILQRNTIIYQTKIIKLSL